MSVYEVVDGSYLVRKERARKAVERAVKKGRLVKPDMCMICADRYNHHNMLHAHHHWGYSRKNELRVVWMCPACHNLCHKQNHSGKYDEHYE